MSMPQLADSAISPPGRNRCGGKYDRDELMHEWEHFRGLVPYMRFAEHLGIDFRAWDRAFRRAAQAGDPRAVRGRYDPARWW